jgi:hypothetical protein
MRWWVSAGAVHGTAWELEEVRGNAVKTMLTLAAISTVASLQVFGKDRLIFWRESASGAALPPASCHDMESLMCSSPCGFTAAHQHGHLRPCRVIHVYPV